MILNLHKNFFFMMAAIALCLAMCFAASAAPAKSPKSPATPHEAKTDTGEWKKILDAAKKEGKIVMSGDTSEGWRKSLVDLFREEYPDISVEYTGISGRDFAQRIRQERQFGQKLWDLRGGGTTTAYDLKREGFLVPIRPLLLPEIADDGKWIGGLDGLFGDKENKFVPTYILYIETTSSVNRDFIKESEMRSSGQLIDPKFKGKIVMQNPSGGGSTFNAIGNFAVMYGENFVRDLLSKQEVIITNDRRQQADWVVRGKYPIAVGLSDVQLIPFIKQGLGKNVIALEDKIIPAGNGFGSLCLFKDAPHPNAARVYINWLLSKNTQIKLTKNILQNSRRTDVPVVEKELAVNPAHLSHYRFYSTEENAEITSRLLPMIREVVKK